MTESKSLLSHLPHLPLDEQTTHVTQEMADRIFDHLVEHYPERMEKIARDEKGHTDALTIMAYAEAMQPVIKDMSKVMDTPDSDLGYIELTFELVRRCRAARGYELPKVIGKPLAPSIEGPYPERLVDKPIVHKAVLEAGFTQELIDAWGDEFYKNEKKACYIYAEASRRATSSSFLTKNPGYAFFRKKAEETRDESLIRHYTMPLNELSSRIGLSCEVITLEKLRNIEEGWNKAAEQWSKS